MNLKPDVVHALRIPFEGMLAESTPPAIPLIVSIWGNDLTFHARTSPLMAAHTRRTLKRADGLLADAARDLALARQWGLRDGIPDAGCARQWRVGSGCAEKCSGGKRASVSCFRKAGRSLSIRADSARAAFTRMFSLKAFRWYLKKIPDAFFVCTAMQGQPQAERWVEDLKLGEHVLLLPYLPQEQLWRLYSRAQIYVSLSSHDGTPNTFLEALACGCFPVVGDIASLREWLDRRRKWFAG